MFTWDRYENDKIFDLFPLPVNLLFKKWILLACVVPMSIRLQLRRSEMYLCLHSSQSEFIPVWSPQLHLTLPYLTLPYLTLPYLTVPYLTLPYLALPCLAILSYHTIYIPYLNLLYFTLLHSTLPCYILFYFNVIYFILPSLSLLYWPHFALWHPPFPLLLGTTHEHYPPKDLQ
jgi:hypothetical protein